jgi:ProP effector
MAPKKTLSSERPVVILRKRTPKPALTPAPPTPPAQSAKPAPVPPQPKTAPPPAAPVPPTTAAPLEPPPHPEPTAEPPAPPGANPDLIAEQQRQQRHQAVAALLQQLMARWPRTFSAYPAAVRPLARGIDKDLVAQVPGSSRRQMGFALAWWQRQRRPAYWQALVRGGPRYDLDGNPKGEVTQEEQEQARQLLAEYFAHRQARRAQGRRAEAPRQPAGPGPGGAERPDVGSPDRD